MRIVLGLGASLACALFGLEWKLGVPLSSEALGFVSLLCEQSHTEFVSGVMVRFVT